MKTIPCFWCREPINFGDSEDAPTYCSKCTIEGIENRPRPKPTREQLLKLAEVIKENGA